MRFDQPVGDQAARDAGAWRGGWVDANPLATRYVNPATGLGAYHTGADLNCNTPVWDADAHTPVLASADGVVVHAANRAVWGGLVVIRHVDGSNVIYTRYGHVEGICVSAGQAVKRGQQIAQVGNANGTMAYHLHFDVSNANLEKNPGDWPGLDLARLQRDYVDPREWINAHREDEGMIVKDMGGDKLNVRASGAANGVLIGALAAGEAVTVLAQGNGWTQIALMDTAKGSAARGWVKSDFLQAAPASPSPAPTPTRARLGINALNRHEEVCYPAAQLGCRFFVILGNPGFASALKDRYPDATVMVRAYWNRQMPSVEGAIAQMDGCRDARLIYTGLNEGDEVGQGTVEQIRQRAEFDLALAGRIKQIGGATYAAGTFSMGEPDFTNPQICSAIRALYAPAYNAGLIWWDHHLYSPSIAHIYQDDGLQWYETRWQFLFTQCGFDPRSKSRVVCSETGEDDGQRHGFAALGRSGDEVAAWGRRFVEVQSRPLVIDGVAHPSPFVGGALFQAGNREDWMGFNAERYYPALEQIWK